MEADIIQNLRSRFSPSANAGWLHLKTVVEELTVEPAAGPEERWPTTTERSVRSFLIANYDVALVFVLLAFTVWCAHFWYSRQFGLYEDDWARVPDTMGITWRGLWDLIKQHGAPIPSQGRPFHPTFIFLFSFLGFKLGGLVALYRIGFAIALANATLFYWFLRRAFLDKRFALFGALAFSLFPADTTQPFLTHALGIQPSIAFALLAFHSYLSGWKKSSYLLIFLSLLTYETLFSVFVVAPLLQRRPKSEVVRHCAVLLGMLVAVFGFRALTAESRVSHLGLLELGLFLTNPVTGPITTLLSYVYRPFQGLFSITGGEAAGLLAFALALTWIFSRQMSSEPDPAAGPGVPSRRTAMIGLIMLVMAYPLTLTTLGFAVAGRGTRAHTAAALGGSILCACVCSVIFSRAARDSRRLSASVGLAAFFALLLAFGVKVQRDYVLSWQQQRGFWTDFVRLCPDLSDGDVVFVEPSGLRDSRQWLFLRKDLLGVPDTRQIYSLEIMFNVLPDIYKFPAGWTTPPLAYRLPVNWKSRIFAGQNELRTISIEPLIAPELTVPASRAIFIETKGGRLTRDFALTDADGQQVQLKQAPAVAPPPLVTAPIYPYVVLPPGEKPIAYLAER